MNKECMVLKAHHVVQGNPASATGYIYLSFDVARKGKLVRKMNALNGVQQRMKVRNSGNRG